MEIPQKSQKIMHIWKGKYTYIKKKKFNINKLNEYFEIMQLNHSQNHIPSHTVMYFIILIVFLHNPIESYINFIEQYDTLCHCVSHLILTLSWDKNYH